VREKKTTKERSIGFNCSMPTSWVDAIDIDSRMKGKDRSQWMREAAVEKMPILEDSEKLKAFIEKHQSQ
jgi:hypothetical protein